MMSFHDKKIKNLTRELAEDESGNVTVEAVIWMPLLLSFFLLIVDASMVFYNKAQILRAAQDLNRSLSLREDQQISAAQATQFLQDSLPGLASKITLPVPKLEPVPSFPGKNYIVTEIVIPSGRLTAVGALNFLPDFDVRIRAVHLDEFQ